MILDKGKKFKNEEISDPTSTEINEDLSCLPTRGGGYPFKSSQSLYVVLVLRQYINTGNY